MTIENNIEIEVKLKINNIEDLKIRIKDLNFLNIQKRGFEKNIVFEHPQLKLKNKGQLLRLRKTGQKSVFTLKKPDGIKPEKQNYKIRREIETEIKDYDKLKIILDFLGFKPYFIYEKYREIYKKRNTQIMIDETPIGNYIEIEGTAADIDQTAGLLGFKKKEYITKSYFTLFLETGRRGNMCFK